MTWTLLALVAAGLVLLGEGSALLFNAMRAEHDVEPVWAIRSVYAGLLLIACGLAGLGFRIALALLRWLLS